MQMPGYTLHNCWLFYKKILVHGYTCTYLYDKHSKYWCEYAMHGPRPSLDHCSLSRSRQTRRGYPPVLSLIQCIPVVKIEMLFCEKCTVLNLVCQLFVARWCLALRRRRGSRTLSTSNILPPYPSYPYPSSHVYIPHLHLFIFSLPVSLSTHPSAIRIEEPTSWKIFTFGGYFQCPPSYLSFVLFPVSLSNYFECINLLFWIRFCDHACLIFS